MSLQAKKNAIETKNSLQKRTLQLLSPLQNNPSQYAGVNNWSLLVIMLTLLRLQTKLGSELGPDAILSQPLDLVTRLVPDASPLHYNLSSG